jgi:hypothetical protein
MFAICRTLLVPLGLSLIVGLSPVAHAADGGKQGKVAVTMRYISGLKQNGSPDPGKNLACHRKFGRLIGMRAVTAYDINPQTLMMSAKTEFAAQTYDLNALGLAGKYAFGQFFRPAQPPLGVYAATFILSLNFSHPVNNFVLVLDPETNCLLSSSATPAADADSSSLGLAAP